MKEPDHPPRLSKNSALRFYRELITWENLHRLRPDLSQLMESVDAGEQTGLISISGFRGSITDQGSRLHCVLIADGEPAATTHFRVKTSSPDDVARAIFAGMAWSIQANEALIESRERAHTLKGPHEGGHELIPRRDSPVRH